MLLRLFASCLYGRRTIRVCQLYLFWTQFSTSCWELEIGCGGSIYTKEISKYYRSELFPPSCFFINIHQQCIQPPPFFFLYTYVLVTMLPKGRTFLLCLSPNTLDSLQIYLSAESWHTPPSKLYPRKLTLFLTFTLKKSGILQSVFCSSTVLWLGARAVSDKPWQKASKK